MPQFLLFNRIDVLQFLARSGRYKKASLSYAFPPIQSLSIVTKQLAAELATLQTLTSSDGDCGELRRPRAPSPFLTSLTFLRAPH
jgi:hypothetical protein